jgi:hypothetical protein
MQTRTVRFNPIERQGPRPFRFLSWPQLIGLAGGSLFVFIVGARGSMWFVLLAIVAGFVGIFIRFGEYVPVEWLVPISRWVRARMSRRRFYMHGSGLPGPLSDSVVLAYETDDTMGGPR